MPLYRYQAAYTSESIAAQIKNPEDRTQTVARPLVEAAGGKLIAAGFTFGEYDVFALIEAPDDETVAALAMTIAAGGAMKAARTSKVLDGSQWVAALTKAADLSRSYRPAR